MMDKATEDAIIAHAMRAPGAIEEKLRAAIRMTAESLVGDDQIMDEEDVTRVRGAGGSNDPGPGPWSEGGQGGEGSGSNTFQPWDYTANDLRLLELAQKVKRELDEADVPDDDPRRVFHVTRETLDDWERRGGRWTEVAGLKIRAA